jgi:poly-gamma-glutamate synthesis protein (capsule biosynthesis protein)
MRRMVGNAFDSKLGKGLAVFVAFLFVVGLFVGDEEDPSRQATSGADAEVVAGPSGVVRPARPEQVTTTTEPPKSFSVVATGDVLLHSQLWGQAEQDAAAAGKPPGTRDFQPMLRGVKPLVSGADLAICHLETPIAAPEGPFSSYPAFSVPPEIAPALAATGFDACSTASNHSLDRSRDGIDRTLATLDAAGIAHAGTARTPTEAGSTTLLNAAGTRVALLSYSYGFNGVPLPEGEPWRANQIDEGRIVLDAAVARQRGAEVVIVALHWGSEYVQEPDAQQLDLAPRLIASPDIDLLLGHHAHVVQPVENIGGEWVVYGMGNMLAYQSTMGPTKEEGLLVRFTFSNAGGAWKVTDAGYEPLLTLRQNPTRLVPVGAGLRDPATPPERVQRLRQAWDRTVEVVGRRAAGLAGLHPINP